MNKTERIIQNINTLLESKNFTEFSESIGFKRQTLSYQLKSASKFPVETLFRIAEGLEVSPCYFLDCEGNKEYKVGNITVGKNSYLKNTLGNNNTVNETNAKYEVRNK